MRCVVLILTLCLAACSIQHSGRDIRVLEPPILADQSWVVSRKDASGCTFSAGEMDITQSGNTVRVATFYPLDPGDKYRVIMGSHIYETQSNTFNDKDSRAIVADMMRGGTVYTERQERVVDIHGSDWRRFSNKISLDGFAKAYQQCGLKSRSGKK